MAADESKEMLEIKKALEEKDREIAELKRRLKFNSKGRPLVWFDWAIEYLLLDKGEFDVVEGFFSELLGRQIKIKNVIERKKKYLSRLNQVYLIVEDEAGDTILIELHFIHETNYYSIKVSGSRMAVVEYMVPNDIYEQIKKIYSINIVYFDFGEGNDYVYYGESKFANFEGIHNKGVLHLSQADKNIFGEIEADLSAKYYILTIQNFNDIVKDTLDEWIYFLKNDLIKDDFTAQGLRKANEILDYSWLSPEEKADYDSEQEDRSRKRSQIASAKLEGRWEMEQKRKEQEKAIREKVIKEQKTIFEEQEKVFEKQAQEIAELKRQLNMNEKKD